MLNKYYFNLLKFFTNKLISKISFMGHFINIEITKSNLLPILYFFKYSQIYNFKTLVDLTLIDNPDKLGRFTVVYIVSSYNFSNRISFFTKVKENTQLISIITLFNSADWAEREVWDMFGITFLFHKNLARILTDYGFSGHPLRKDFPLSGFLEIAFSKKLERLIYVNVDLEQEYRNLSLKEEKFVLNRR